MFRLTARPLYQNYLTASSLFISSLLLTEKRIQNSKDSLPIMKSLTFFFTACIFTVIIASEGNNLSLGKKGKCFKSTQKFNIEILS